MYQWRDMMLEGGGAVAVPRAFGRLAPARYSAPKPFSLIVDLAAERLSPTWWRGAATLALLCGTAAVLAPTFEPLAMAGSSAPDEQTAREYRDLGVAPLGAGGRSGGQMVRTSESSRCSSPPSAPKSNLMRV